jgi:hypothetical protein
MSPLGLIWASEAFVFPPLSKRSPGPLSFNPGAYSGEALFTWPCSMESDPGQSFCILAGQLRFCV